MIFKIIRFPPEIKEIVSSQFLRGQEDPLLTNKIVNQIIKEPIVLVPVTIALFTMKLFLDMNALPL